MITASVLYYEQYTEIGSIFYSVKRFISFLFSSTCQEQNLSFLVLIFYHLWYLHFKHLFLAILEIPEVRSRSCLTSKMELLQT